MLWAGVRGEGWRGDGGAGGEVVMGFLSLRSGRYHFIAPF